jgi:hypothetical protein
MYVFSIFKGIFVIFSEINVIHLKIFLTVQVCEKIINKTEILQ